MDKILQFIRDHKAQYGYEPEKMAIHKATGESRPKIDAEFIKYVERGQVELLDVPRSRNYVIKWMETTYQQGSWLG